MLRWRLTRRKHYFICLAKANLWHPDAPQTIILWNRSPINGMHSTFTSTLALNFAFVWCAHRTLKFVFMSVCVCCVLETLLQPVEQIYYSRFILSTRPVCVLPLDSIASKLIEFTFVKCAQNAQCASKMCRLEFFNFHFHQAWMCSV